MALISAHRSLRAVDQAATIVHPHVPDSSDDNMRIYGWIPQSKVSRLDFVVGAGYLHPCPRSDVPKLTPKA
jgi:hypothetical protein